MCGEPDSTGATGFAFGDSCPFSCSNFTHIYTQGSGTASIGREQRGRHVALRVQASHQQFQVELNGQLFKTLPIKGLQHQLMSLEDYLPFVRQQAVSEHRNGGSTCARLGYTSG